MKLKKGTEQEYAVFRAERTLEPDYRSTLLYMEHWADAMERELEKGATMEQAVLKSRAQNAEAISLHGYRWALRLLCYVWEYGDQLKQWQKDSQDDYQCPNRPPGQQIQGDSMKKQQKLRRCSNFRKRIIIFQKWSVKIYQIPNHPYWQQNNLVADSLCRVPKGI